MTALAPRASARLVALALAPYLVVSTVHLAAKPLELSALDGATRPLLMPLLLGAMIVLALREALRMRVAVPLAAGLVLSWLGDLTLGELTVGLGFFLAAHVAYIAAFWLGPPRRLSPWGLVAIPWFVGLLIGLAPSLGPLLPLLAAYGVVLGAMAVSATRAGLVASIGGALFVVSDSLLAVRLFTPALQSPWEDALIMATYLAAQPLLVLGALAASRRPAPVPVAAPA